MQASLEIGNFMRGLMTSYESVRGKSPGSVGIEFWDLVVISAGDVSQQTWYEAQLQLKQDSGDLPLVPYLIIPDPPGPRIGSGGSTLHILNILKQKYENELNKMKILLIHAGGYSKRLPSHSCSGKIFSPLPIQPGHGGPYQMLDLKLAMYLPFLSMMQPGVFVTASDDIEVYNMTTGAVDTSLMSGETVTALAHPSSLYIGTTHGVYVLTPGASSGDLQEARTCDQVLQKPSVDLMREKGAVQVSEEGEEIVFSDSAFWFHSQTTDKLVQLQQELGKIDTEICIYGDFLTCLGKNQHKDYVDKLNKSDSARKDVQLKKKLNEKVGATDLTVLALNQSKFYHLGTTQEYLHGLTSDKCLRQELNLANIVSSHISQTDNINGIVLNSVIENNLSLPHDSIIEYSIIKSKV